jgi:hypothetical protein
MVVHMALAPVALEPVISEPALAARQLGSGSNVGIDESIVHRYGSLVAFVCIAASCVVRL